MAYSETHLRQLDVLPEEVLNKPITVIGLGGIGSPTAYMLAKIGCKDLHLVDFDKVDEHNIATQMYGRKQIGEYKAKALAEKIQDELPVETIHSHTTAAKEMGREHVVIMALDSMKARTTIWENTKDMPEWVIDGRMGLEFARIYAFSPLDDQAVESYKKSLYTDEEAVELPCSARAVVYNTFFIGSLISSIVKKILIGEEVPFETMADIGAFGIKTFPASSNSRTRRA